MLSFFQLFALSAIAMALGEEAPPQAMALKETKLEEPVPPALTPNLQLDASGPSKDAHTAAKPVAEPAASDAASVAATGVQAPQAPKESPGSNVADGPPVSQIEGTTKDHVDENGVVDEAHSLPQQQADVDNELLRTIPFCGVLFSFVGVVSYTLFFLYQILHGRTKSKGQGSSGAAVPSLSNNHEELDFEDLEIALNMTVTTPVNRKKCGGGGLVEEPEVLAKEQVRDGEAGTNCSETTSPSDDGWGNGGWADDGWDSLDDCEAELNAVDAIINKSIPPSKPLAPAKGKGKAD